MQREVEQAGALSQAALEAQRGVMLSVRAETASHYIRLRGAQNQLAVLRQTLDNANRNLALTRLRQREGVATELDVSQADAQAAAIEAAVPPLALRVDQLMNALALLLDQPPHGAARAAGNAGAHPGGPVRVPVGLPSELAERRPDIRQAQARLHAAVAAIGVAEGDFYPRITLSATSGCRRCNWATWTPTAPASSAWARRCRSLSSRAASCAAGCGCARRRPRRQRWHSRKPCSAPGTMSTMP